MDYLKFLENNVDIVKKYKKDWYDEYELKELSLTKDVIKKFENILNDKLVDEENKILFRKFFIEELNKAFEGGFAPTDEKYLLEVLEKIEKK